MTKRPSNRPPNVDTTGSAAQPKKRRRGDGAAPAPESVTVVPTVEGTENHDAAQHAASQHDEPAALMSISGEAQDASPRESAADWQRTASSAMASEPSDDDIRMRAYQRYVERGAGEGRQFEDWLEAERELKSAK
jgi:hypothetical protein